MGSAICGGVMSQTQLYKGVKKYGAYFGMMAFVMPDKKYGIYNIYLKQGRKKEAKELFNKYAMSQI